VNTQQHQLGAAHRFQENKRQRPAKKQEQDTSVQELPAGKKKKRNEVSDSPARWSSTTAAAMIFVAASNGKIKWL